MPLRWACWLPVLAALAGCARYHPQPLDPAGLERDYRSRSLEDPGLRAIAGAAWPPAELDLPSLMRVASYYSPELALAKARLRTVEAEQITAGARPNPQLSVGGGYTNSPEAPLVFHFDPALTLETAGKRRLRLLEAQKRAESARLEVAETGWRVRSQVRAAWFAYWYARRSGEGLEAERALRAETVSLLEVRLRAGAVARPSVNVARVALAQADIALAAQRGQVAEGLANLAAAAGLPVTALERQRLSAPLWRPPQGLRLERLQKAGLLHRIDVRRGLLDYAAAEATLALEVARQYPDVQLSPGYSFDEGHHKFTFGPAFSIPVFHRNQGPIAEAEGRRAEAQARFLGLQAQAIGEMERALAAYQAAVAELEETENRAAKLQNEREQALRRALQAGEEDRLALNTVRVEGALAVRARIEALHRAEGAFGALEDALQQPIEVP